jgi:hypothetical protein
LSQRFYVVGNQGSGRVAELAGYELEGTAVNQIPAVNGFGTRGAEVHGIAIEGRVMLDVGGVLA